MVFPGIGRQAWVSGSLGGGTGRSTDWSTYTGTQDTAWQVMVDETSTQLANTYSTISHNRNAFRMSSTKGALVMENGSTITLTKITPDQIDPSSATFKTHGSHTMTTPRACQGNKNDLIVIASPDDNGTLVAYDNDFNTGGKITGFNNTGSSIDNHVVPEVLSDSPYGKYPGSGPYTNWFSMTKTDKIHLIWKRSNNNITQKVINLSDQNTLISSPSGYTLLDGTADGVSFYNHTEFNTDPTYWDVVHLDQQDPTRYNQFANIASARLKDKFLTFVAIENNTTNRTKMGLLLTFSSTISEDTFGGGDVGNGPEGQLARNRNNSELYVYDSTGRPAGNSAVNMLRASKAGDRSAVFLYGDERGTNGGNLYLAATTSTYENLTDYPTIYDSNASAVGEYVVYTQPASANTHNSSSVAVSNTPGADSSSTAFSPDKVWLGKLQSNYIAVLWKKSTSVYISIFSLLENTSSEPTITRVVDSIDIGTVTLDSANPGNLSCVALGNGVALVTCGNYYKFIKVPK